MASEKSLKISALIERAGRLLAADTHAGGLLPVHWEVLRYLAKANQFSRTHAALTAYLGLTKGTVSQTLKALEGKGLVQKEADVRDRRSYQLSLTQRGRRLLARDPLEVWAEQLEVLPKAERDGLEKGLSSLLNGLLVARGRAPFGQCRDCVHFAATHTEGAPHYCKLLETPLSKQSATLICAEQSS